MTVTLRRISVTASWSGGSFTNILSAHVSLGFDARVGTATIVTPIVPGCGQDDEVTIDMGVVGSNVITRFVGLVRDFQYSYVPRGVATVLRGRLTRAAEYENWEDPTLVGGLTIDDLTGSPTATASDIVQAALDKAGVSYSGGNIDGTSTVYGSIYDDAFVWHNGANESNPDIQEAGETALSYIERYDEIDAEFSSGHGGRYRTFESLGGVVYRFLVGGRPRNSNDFTFTETVDILDGAFSRSTDDYRNYFVVTGYDPGDGFGPLFFATTPPGSNRTYRFSSPMLERSEDSDPGDGMSCETVANAISLDYNREIVKGWITTFRDDEIGIAQTHLVQAPGGAVDRLGVGEPLWVQSLDITVDDQGFTQRIGYLGGGVDSSLSAPP